MKPKPTTERKPLTLRRVKSVLNRRFGGVIKPGKHDENGKCCVLELASVLRGVPWTDDPESVRSFDLRALNDIPVPDELRAEWMAKLLVAYDGSLDWPADKQRRVVERTIVLTVNRLIAELPGLPVNIAEQCRVASVLDEARAANAAARVANAAARAANAAANAANAAARAANAAAREKVFITACQLWLEVAKEDL